MAEGDQIHYFFDGSGIRIARGGKSVDKNGNSVNKEVENLPGNHGDGVKPKQKTQEKGVDLETFENIRSKILDLVSASKCKKSRRQRLYEMMKYEMSRSRNESDSENYMSDSEEQEHAARASLFKILLGNTVPCNEPRKQSSWEKQLINMLSECSPKQRKELMTITNPEKYYDHIPLSLACKNRNLNLAKFFVQSCGAPIDGKDDDGKPLLWAIIRGDEEMVKYLLDQGADCSKKLEGRCSLFMFSMRVPSFIAPQYFGYEYRSNCWSDEESESEDSFNENSDDDSFFPFFGGRSRDEDDEDDYEDEEEEDEEDENDDDDVCEDDGDEDWEDLDEKEEQKMKNRKKENACKGKKKTDVDDLDRVTRKHKKKREKEKIEFPEQPSLEIVNMFINHGAVEKCTEDQLFDIFMILLPEESRNVFGADFNEQFQKACLALIMERLPNWVMVKKDNDMTMLGYHLVHKDYNYKRCQISSYVDRILHKSDGTEVNNANVLKYYDAPLTEGQQDTIEANIDNVLAVCQVDKETNDAKCVETSENPTTRKYVHPIVYLASTGKELIETCLSMPKIPFQALFDGLEASGAHMVKMMDSMMIEDCSLECWNLAEELRREHSEMLDNPDSVQVSSYEKALIEEHYNGFTDSLGYDPISGAVKERHEELLESPVELIPFITVEEPKRSFVSYLPDFKEIVKDLDEDGRLEITKLIRGALIHERLIGYGSHETMKAFDALIVELARRKKVSEMVNVIVYGFPYFLKLISHEENYPVGEYTKSYTLHGSISRLVDVVLNKDYLKILSFGQLMAAWKCTYLNCIGTQKRGRGFQEIAPLLVLTRVLHNYTKNEEEEKRFDAFMRRIVVEDPRNSKGQSLLHYVCAARSKQDVRQHKWEKYVLGCLKLVTVLLSHGANPNSFDEYGLTPLHLCCQILKGNLMGDEDNKHKKIIQILIKNGAHLDCVDMNNQTPISLSQDTSVHLCPAGRTSLQCLASRVIVKRKIPYEEVLTAHQKTFVDLHKKKGTIKEKALDQIMALYTTNKSNHGFFIEVGF